MGEAWAAEPERRRGQGVYGAAVDWRASLSCSPVIKVLRHLELRALAGLREERRFKIKRELSLGAARQVRIEQVKMIASSCKWPIASTGRTPAELAWCPLSRCRLKGLVAGHSFQQLSEIARRRQAYERCRRMQ